MKIIYVGSFNDKDYFHDENGCFVNEKGQAIFMPCSVIDRLKYTKEVFTKEV